MKQPYLLCSNYFARPGSKWEPWFFKLWMRNVMPQRTLLVISGELPPPYDDCDLVTAPLKKLHLEGDLGSVMNVINKEKDNALCGWSGAVLQMALSAYIDKSDFVYQEMDALVFGPCIERMYDEIGNGGIIFGSTSCQPCAQSLFLVKHEYILEFVRLYISQGSQALEGNLGEQIFARLERENPDKWKRFSFGYDRTRPLNIKDKCWYAQKFSPIELLELRAAGMVKFDSLPEGVDVFSSAKI